MKILMVAGNFYPNNSPRAFRTTELAKRFCILGHNVTVFIPKTNYDFKGFLDEYPINLCWYHKVQERNKFIGIPFIDRIIHRVVNQFFTYPDRWNIKPVMNALKNESGYDLLITIAMPHSIHWAFGKLYNKGIKAAKCWVADCGDPFMLTQTNSFRPPFYVKPLETRWCRLCNYISVPTRDSINGYYPEYKDKIRVIPQGFDFSEVKRSAYEAHKKPTFAFSGSFIPGRRDLRPILDLLLKKDLEFELHVFTRQKNMFESYEEKMGERLKLHEYIPRLELLEILSGMDFLLNLDNGITVQTPSKLIDYALTGRPILSLNSSNIDENLLFAFMKGDYSGQYIVENIEQYNIVNVAQQFLDLCS